MPLVLSTAVSVRTVQSVGALTPANGEMKSVRTLDDQPHFPEFRYILSRTGQEPEM